MKTRTKTKTPKPEPTLIELIAAMDSPPVPDSPLPPQPRRLQFNQPHTITRTCPQTHVRFTVTVEHTDWLAFKRPRRLQRTEEFFPYLLQWECDSLLSGFSQEGQRQLDAGTDLESDED